MKKPGDVWSNKKFRYRSFTDLPATLVPHELHIAWAAGIYEGEGTPTVGAIVISQKDPWILHELQKLWGGSVNYYTHRSYGIFHWRISGENARTFVAHIWIFLSPRRKAQILKHWVRDTDFTDSLKSVLEKEVCA